MDFSEKSIEGGDGSRRADKRRRGGRDERQGGFRKRGNSLEGFHAGTRPRATAQSIELSISRLGGSSDKVTHPLVPHLPFASRSSRPLFCFSSLSLRACVCVFSPSSLSTFRLRRFDLRLLERSWRSGWSLTELNRSIVESLCRGLKKPGEEVSGIYCRNLALNRPMQGTCIINVSKIHETRSACR